jgi:hypothetical protein
MGVRVAVLIIVLLEVGVAALERAAKARIIDAGEVSESWLREQRAEKQDRYPS